MNVFLSKTATVDLHLTRGDTFYFNFGVKGVNDQYVDFASFDYARMHIRKFESDTVVLMFSSSGNTIDISNRGSGQFVVSGSSELLIPESYVYDFEIGKDNFKETVMAGQIFVTSDISR